MSVIVSIGLTHTGRHVHYRSFVSATDTGQAVQYYTRPEVDQAEAVITWHGDLIRSYAVQATSEKVTRLANETITMLRNIIASSRQSWQPSPAFGSSV